MAVYVDDAEHAYGPMKMCHMIADTTEELYAMADRIGVRRKWIQKAGTGNEHFDIAKGKRSEAIAHGAVPITERQCAAMCYLRRNYYWMGSLCDPESALALMKEFKLKATRS